MGESKSFKFVVPCDVVAATDGDTLKVDVDWGLYGSGLKARRVRLTHIQAPELKGRGAEESVVAEMVRRHVAEELCPPGETATLTYHKRGAEDLNGRILGHIINSKGVDVADALLVAGLVKPYNGEGRAPVFSRDELNEIVNKLQAAKLARKAGGEERDDRPCDGSPGCCDKKILNG
jgi:endonuclease YncB( thermonuclease family)